MSLLTTLLGAYGGYGRGKNEAFQRGLEQRQQQTTETYDDAQIQAERDRLAQEKAYQNAQLHASGVDASGNPLPLPPIQGQPIKPPAANADPMTQMRYYDALANQARDMFAKSGDPRYKDLATSYDTAGQKYASGLYNIGGYDYRTQGQIPEAQARAGEAKARAYYYQNLNQTHVDIAHAKNAVDQYIAAGHDKAHITAAQDAASASIQRAGITGNASVEGRILAGYFALQGADVRSAAEQATEAVRAAENYAATEGKSTGSFDNSGDLVTSLVSALAGANRAPQVDPAQSIATAMAIASALQGAGKSGQPVTAQQVQQIVQKAMAAGKTGGAAGLPPIAREIQNAHAAGVKDPSVIRAKLLGAGYSAADVDKALGGKITPPPVGNALSTGGPSVAGEAANRVRAVWEKWLKDRSGGGPQASVPFVTPPQ